MVPAKQKTSPERREQVRQAMVRYRQRLKDERRCLGCRHKIPGEGHVYCPQCRKARREEDAA